MSSESDVTGVDVAAAHQRRLIFLLFMSGALYSLEA